MQANHNNSRERGFCRILAILVVGIHVPGLCLGAEPLTVADNVALPGAIEIEGDTIQLRLDRQMRATGNAVIRKNGQEIAGDDIRYDLQNDELQVEGNVSITGGRAEIKGPILKMRLSENIGEMRDVSIEFKPAPPDPNAPEAPPELLSDQALFVSDPKRYLEDSQASSTLSRRSPFENSRGTAKLILFEGQDKKTLKSASYTTCPADVDDWYIKAGSMEMNDYTSTGKAKNAYVEFKGYPILYTPYMSFSYKNQRKSGFLSPLIGSTSRSGFQVLTPYYINISPDMDATIATNVLSRRGTQLQGEFRYLGETYSGVDNVEYLDKDSLTGKSRYYAKLTHKQQFNEYWSGGYSYEQVSDNQYFSDLATRIITTSRVNLGQGGYLNYGDEHWSFSGVVQRYQNLDDKSFVYQRLPQLTLSYSNQWQGLKTYDYAQVTYFDSLPQAGTVPTGLRTVVNPSISYPMKSSYGYITPKIGVHSTNYDLSNNLPTGYNQQYNQLQRTLPIFSVDSALYFDKQSEFFGTSFTQTIEPRMMYLYVPYHNQNMFPVFDSARKTLNLTTLFSENQFGGNDRVNNANQVTMAVTSRLIDTETGIERISTTLGQQYYLTDSKVILPTETVSPYGKSSLIAGMTARLSNRLNVDTFFQYDPNKSQLQRSNFAIRYNPEPGKNFDFGYRRTVGVLDQFNASGQWPLGNSWYAVGRYNYSFYDVKLIESMAGLEYDAGCWVGRMVMQRYATATATANTAIFFQLELGGITSIGSNPLTVIRRDIPSYMRSVDIPSVYRDQNTQ